MKSRLSLLGLVMMGSLVAGCHWLENLPPLPWPSPAPSTSPSSSPSGSPGPAPSPSPSASPVPSPTPVPTPSPSPSPLPSPSPSPSSSPSGYQCILGEDGNFPIPEEGTCPVCWRTYGEPIIQYWGIAFRSKTPCSGPNCPWGIKINVDITPHSKKPFLRHRTGVPGGGGTETWPGCQPPVDSPLVPDIWVYPPNDVAGICDPFSGSRYWCHHKPQGHQGGATRFEVRHGLPPYRFVIVNVP